MDSSDLDSDEEDEEAHSGRNPAIGICPMATALEKLLSGSGGPFSPLVDDKSQSGGRPRGKENDQSSVLRRPIKVLEEDYVIWDPSPWRTSRPALDDVQTNLGRTNLIQSTFSVPESSGKTR